MQIKVCSWAVYLTKQELGTIPKFKVLGFPAPSITQNYNQPHQVKGQSVRRFVGKGYPTRKDGPGTMP